MVQFGCLMVIAGAVLTAPSPDLECRWCSDQSVCLHVHSISLWLYVFMSLVSMRIMQCNYTWATIICGRALSTPGHTPFHLW